MANTNIFKGIQQVMSLPANPEKGIIYFVGNGVKGGEGTKVYFGTRCYGEVSSTAISALQAAVSGNTESIKTINTILGNWAEQFKGEITTVASAVVAVSGATSALETSFETHTGNTTVHITAEEREKWNTAEGLKHEHTNKAVLDGITAEKVEGWDDAVAKKHEHANKAVLDGITADKVEDWDAAEGNAKAYTDGLLGTGFTPTDTVRKAINDLATAARTYSIKEVTSGLSENVLEAWGIFDDMNMQRGETIKIYKDSSLKEVKLEGQELKFTYILANGSESTVGVDVSAFLAESEFNTDSFAVSSGGAVDLSASVKTSLGLADTAVQAVAEGATNGTISVDGEDVAVHGLGSAAFAQTTAFDAAGAAASALTEANKYTDGKDTAMAARVKAMEDKVTDWDDAVSKEHEHANKELLDTYTQTEANLADAVAKKHEHTNKAELDKIVEGDKAKWDAAEGNAKAYTDGLLGTGFTSTDTVTSVIAGINERLSSITNNAITSVASSGKTITVSETSGAVNVEVNIMAKETAQNNGYVAIEKSSEGALYGVMYYGGDDAE